MADDIPQDLREIANAIQDILDSDAEHRRELEQFRLGSARDRQIIRELTDECGKYRSGALIAETTRETIAGLTRERDEAKSKLDEAITTYAGANACIRASTAARDEAMEKYRTVAAHLDECLKERDEAVQERDAARKERDQARATAGTWEYEAAALRRARAEGAGLGKPDPRLPALLKLHEEVTAWLNPSARHPSPVCDCGTCRTVRAALTVSEVKP